MDKLKQALTSIGPIMQEEWSSFSKIWNEIEVGRKVNLTSIGQVEDSVYFVMEGIQRLYHLDGQGRESTIVLTYEGDFGGVLDSSLLQKPSDYYYETLSKSRLLKCSYTDFNHQLGESKNLSTIFDNAIYQAFSGTMMRLVELQTMNSEEKFRKLLGRSPHILNMIPHKYLANYIGIDATNFSKLLNKIKINN